MYTLIYAQWVLELFLNVLNLFLVLVLRIITFCNVILFHFRSQYYVVSFTNQLLATTTIQYSRVLGCWLLIW